MGHRYAPEAAVRLAEYMLRMRIEVRKLAFESSGSTKDRHFAEVYRLMREYEDAEVRDMLNGTRDKDEGRNKRKRRKRIRKEATDRVVVEKKRARKPDEKHPWRATAKKTI